MSHYVIGDIHGCYEELLGLLQAISFDATKDIVIFLGDYIDRGLRNYEVLRWIDRVKNDKDHYVLLRGNHEQEFIANIELLTQIKADIPLAEVCERLHEKSQYFDLYSTIRQLVSVNHVGIATLSRWANMFKEMPTHLFVEVNHTQYVIVHAGYKDARTDDICEFELYSREEAYLEGGISNGVVIAGHTPTIIPGEFVFTGGKVFRYHNNEINCTYYDIDCGCVFRKNYPEAKLACIRLEDQEVFYY